MRSISPPRVSRSGTDSPRPVAAQTNPVAVEIEDDDDVSTASESPTQPRPSRESGTTMEITQNGILQPQATNLPTHNFIASPFKLMLIRDLPSSQNRDTISLHDVLGNPLIKEAWIFNFCFDVDWMMTHFDPDVRDLVKVKVVHGSWRNEDGNRIGIEDACRRWPNVEAATAYLPDPFGTHHSKMFVLFTHDDQAQVIIHTANMLNKDWSNMTQAVWQSPLLPRANIDDSGNVGPYGSGSRFKHDFMAYLKAYGSKTKALRDQLGLFNFNGIKGALVSSVPSRTKEEDFEEEDTLWGYPRLCKILREIKQPPPSTTRPHLVCQVSSIATLSVTWLTRFFNSLFKRNDNHKLSLDQVSIIYPTPSNVASSLDGYAAGGSIHTKAQSAAHLKQITTLHNTLSQWTEGPSPAFRAQRHEAAPHIKTYVQYRERPTLQQPTPDIDWALLTSANLSTQAWGAFREKEKEVVVQSFEIGVLVWPGLFSEGFDSQPAGGGRDDGSTPHPNDVRMVPVFGKDMPSQANVTASVGTTPTTAVVGLRIPYDLPLTRYGSTELPWSPHGTYESPDRHGRRWPRHFA
ncbi:hypothetical protein LTR84_012532 [Exophiala bonariae]|uniref:Tyrosyl-DNA phosphodiesterase n=1 Tax=Exophiala bonariae TaxID=1690606 RepID=A0AAV9NEM1_9EURO|nr:hypothetical protein LTR84_012532 [Exophiala bonariae]